MSSIKGEITMKKILILSGLAATLALSASVAMADLNTCVEAAMRGPGKKFVKVKGHDFHCKRVEVVPLGGGAFKVIGRLSHQISLRPDDEVDYEFVLQKGTMKDSPKIDIDRGGLSPLIGEAASAIGKFVGRPVSSQDVEAVSRNLAGQVTGRSWDKAAELIVSTVALKMANEAHIKCSKQGLC
jgi:hypothetical protein